MSVSVQLFHSELKKGHTGEKAIRKDAVKFLSLILSGTNEQTWEIQKKSSGLFLEWQRANIKFWKMSTEKEYCQTRAS